MLRKLALLGLVTAVSGCSLNEPQSPTDPTPSVNQTPPPPGTSVGTSTGVAPNVVSPASGSELTDDRPTLTVTNVTLSGGTPTYAMEVASDASFTSMVDQAQGIPQGAEGRTSWRVTTALAPGQYFWRARASVGSTVTPYSAVANFILRAPGTAPGPGPSPSPQGVVISDPLANGSLGQVGGGQFTGRGWQVTSVGDFIRYEVPPIESGYVEWENTGLQPMNRTLESYMLFGMWDPTRGAYRENPFRVNLQKLDSNHNRPYIRLRWISESEEHNGGNNFIDWNPNQVYRWRLEWGPDGGGNVARVTLDGGEIISQTYGPAYRPAVHYVELGIEERRESVIGAVYSNLRIGRR